MKLVTILVSLMFAGSAFANGHEKAATPAPGTTVAADQTTAAPEAPVKKEHKKKKEEKAKH